MSAAALTLGVPAFAGTTTIFHLAPGSDITPRATRRFQMDSTTSAPIVAVMKPGP